MGSTACRHPGVGPRSLPSSEKELVSFYASFYAPRGAALHDGSTQMLHAPARRARNRVFKEKGN